MSWIGIKSASQELSNELPHKIGFQQLESNQHAKSFQTSLHKKIGFNSLGIQSVCQELSNEPTQDIG